MDHISIRKASFARQPFSIIIPAYNEEKQLAQTITAVKSLEAKEIIVVDDASKDRTGEIAHALGTKVITHSMNRGKTEALLSGLREAKTKWVLLLDADLGQSARYAQRLLQGLDNPSVDMVVAYIPTTGKGGFGLVRRFAQWAIYIMTGQWFIAPLSGQRLIKREQFLDTYTRDVGFGFEVGLTLDYCFSGLNVLEIEAPFKHRELGKTMHGFQHRAKQGFSVIRAIGQRFKRLPIFFLGKLRGRLLR